MHQLWRMEAPPIAPLSCLALHSRRVDRHAQLAVLARLAHRPRELHGESAQGAEGCSALHSLPDVGRTVRTETLGRKGKMTMHAPFGFQCRARTRMIGLAHRRGVEVVRYVRLPHARCPPHSSMQAPKTRRGAAAAEVGERSGGAQRRGGVRAAPADSSSSEDVYGCALQPTAQPSPASPQRLRTRLRASGSDGDAPADGALCSAMHARVAKAHPALRPLPS